MLISYSSLLLFVTGAAILLVIPGPAVFYIVSRSVGHGRAAGLVSAMGIAAGTLFHLAAATLGLSALLASSALAFQFVKYLGAAYLAYLGIRVSRSDVTLALEAANGQRQLAQYFWPWCAGESPKSQKQHCFFWRFCRSSWRLPAATRRFRFFSSACCLL